MIQDENPLVQRVGVRVADALHELSSLFKPGAKLTFLARHPDAPDGSRDMVITEDDLGEVIAALSIRRQCELSKALCAAAATQEGEGHE